MAFPTVVNSLGTLTGWSKVVTRILGRNLVGIRAVSYMDSMEIENEMGTGHMPIGESEGNYSAEGSVELLIEEDMLLQQALRPGARFQDIAPFDIEVSYMVNGVITTDRLRNCRFMDRGREISQGDKTISKSYKLKVSHIEWNV